ncbi:DUF72 domain-containing protein [Pokkaliibacter sp. CJK22405]|uniref:DUF72 domain-containing protein n=1 Tax=Pokkaliibacter sp. CJK22405 TaxID=3384615 RepID=UPI0039851CE0
MTLPYYLGCPQWQHPRWKTQLPSGYAPLEAYSQVFNTVEGNTTFYATPTQAQCEQWRAQVPDTFRFLFKLPKSITHDALLRDGTRHAQQFLRQLEPLHEVMGPLLLQLSARFGPEHLDDLWRLLDEMDLAEKACIEVRHPSFFAKGEEEKALNQGIRDRGLARVCFDSRGLFAAKAEDESTKEAQRKKPQVPVHILPSEADPVVRFIGHPQCEMNDSFLLPWAKRFAQWIGEGKRPYLFLHMPDNGEALNLVRRWQPLLESALGYGIDHSLPEAPRKEPSSTQQDLF